MTQTAASQTGAGPAAGQDPRKPPRGTKTPVAKGRVRVPTVIQMELKELATAGKPLIVYWAFQHFMVLEGVRKSFGKTLVHVNDPANGPRVIEWEEFDSGFTGIVLTFEPGPEFSPGGRPVNVLGALLRRRQRTGRALPLILLASLLLIPAGLVTPAFNQIFIDWPGSWCRCSPPSPPPRSSRSC